MTKHEIEYEDAPSGNVTFYNYKEPLMKFTEGYGYLGALVFDTETDKVQCHFCGEWFIALAPHLKREHNMKVSAYKEAVGLFQTTALIGEKMRAKLIKSGLNKRLQNLRQAHLKRKANGFKKSKETIEKTRATVKTNAEKPEWKNLRGTCPDQLIDRLQKLYKKQRENFSTKHIGFNPLLVKTYGSIKNACKIAGVPYRKPGQNKNYNHKIKYTEDLALDFIKEFIARNNKIPTRKDFRLQGQEALWDKFFASNPKKLRKLSTLAYSGMEDYRKNDQRIYYSKQDLLKFLTRFEQINGRKPSTSDGKRGLIPPPQRYIYHFGGWKNALNLAFHD